MKLELLDTYHIRVRLSASIIVLAPVAITIFLCFQEIATIASSSILIAVLLSLTNYLPIVQRQIYQKKLPFKNYAAQFLMPNDEAPGYPGRSRGQSGHPIGLRGIRWGLPARQGWVP